MRGWYVFGLVAVLSLAFLGCEDDPVDDGMVTIAGKVRNVDTAAFAAGVRVRLYGTQYADEAPTGSDGSYELRIPRGSKVLLYTDDFNASDDVWFPLVNVDMKPVYADEDILDWPIHACPWFVDANLDTVGSVNVWTNYLADCDDTENGDVFDTHAPEDAKGIVAMLFGQACDLFGPDSLDVTFNSPDAPFLQVNLAAMAPSTTPASLQCKIYHPATVTWTDPGWAWAQSFLDDTFVGDHVTVSVIDLKPGRGFTFPAEFEVPVAPGVISLVLVGILNGQGVNFPKLAKECSLFN